MENSEIKFKLEYGVSKKGNKTVTVIQIPTEKYPHSNKQGFSCLQKYNTIIKVKTVDDAEYFKEYLNKTVEEVFEIAFKAQNWRLIPFAPITQSITLNTAKVPDWVYGNPGDWDK